RMSLPARLGQTIAADSGLAITGFAWPSSLTELATGGSWQGALKMLGLEKSAVTRLVLEGGVPVDNSWTGPLWSVDSCMISDWEWPQGLTELRLPRHPQSRWNLRLACLRLPPSLKILEMSGNWIGGPAIGSAGTPGGLPQKLEYLLLACDPFFTR